MFSNTYFYPINTGKIKWSVIGQRISAVEARMIATLSPDPFPTLPVVFTSYCGLLCVPSTVPKALKDITTKYPCPEHLPLHTRSTTNVCSVIPVTTAGYHYTHSR